MKETEIRVPVNGGYIVAGRNPDLDYDGIYIVFETSDGDIMDLVVVESTAADEYHKTNIYTYGNVWNEDFTNKQVIDHDDIYEALYENGGE